MRRLILFDIDGTLSAKSPGYSERFSVALRQVHNVYVTEHMINNYGMTDQQIVRALLLKVGIPVQTIDANMSEVLAAMCAYAGAVQPYLKVQALDGVAETLESLDDGNNLLGLVTGNLEPIAHYKLSSAGIDQHFTLGGFGSDAEERSELVAKAISDAAQKFGFTDQDNIYLFGDAPQDIQAALAGGAKPIGVTTGTYSNNELRAAGARKVIRSMREAEAALLD